MRPSSALCDFSHHVPRGRSGREFPEPAGRHTEYRTERENWACRGFPEPVGRNSGVWEVPLMDTNVVSCMRVHLFLSFFFDVFVRIFFVN